MKQVTAFAFALSSAILILAAGISVTQNYLISVPQNALISVMFFALTSLAFAATFSAAAVYKTFNGKK